MSSFALRAGTALVLMAFTPFFGDNVKTFFYCIIAAIVGQVSLAVRQTWTAQTSKWVC